MYYLLSRSYLIQQSHIFNHVTNSTVLPRFTFSSISKVYKFTGLIWFHSLISFNSPTHSTVSQIQFYYLLSRSYLILLSQHIQQWNKFNSLIFLHHILFNSSMYSKVQQSQWSFLGLHSHLFNSRTYSKVSQIQLYYLLYVHISFNSPNIFNIVTNLVVLSTFTFISHSTVPHIQPCNKFNCLTSFYILIYFKSVQIHWSYLIPQSNFIQQSHTFNSVTNSVLLSNFTFISHSTVSTYSTMKQIQQSSFLHHILFNSSMYSKVQQSQWSFLGLHSHLFQQSHLFKSVTN